MRQEAKIYLKSTMNETRIDERKRKISVVELVLAVGREVPRAELRGTVQQGAQIEAAGVECSTLLALKSGNRHAQAVLLRGAKVGAQRRNLRKNLIPKVSSPPSPFPSVCAGCWC